MKNKILIAMLATVILITFAGCGQIQTAQCEKSKTADTSSASVTSDTEISDDAAAESSSSAVDSEIPTEIETTVPAPESTAKVSTQKTAQPSVSAKKDTQKKQSEPFENTGVPTSSVEKRFRQLPIRKQHPKPQSIQRSQQPRLMSLNSILIIG